MVFSFVLILVVAHSIQHGIPAPFTLYSGFPFHLPGLFWHYMLLGTTLDKTYGKVDGTDSF